MEIEKYEEVKEIVEEIRRIKSVLGYWDKLANHVIFHEKNALFTESSSYSVFSKEIFKEPLELHLKNLEEKLKRI